MLVACEVGVCGGWAFHPPQLLYALTTFPHNTTTQPQSTFSDFVLGERTVYINEAQERVTLSGPGGSNSQRSPRGEGGAWLIDAVMP